MPEQWPEEKIPRWYAWWRLHDIQDGTCATCGAPAYAIDHDHHTGLVRGLLCISCNHLEGECGRSAKAGTHPGEPCFQAYWETPPAGPLRWLYGKTTLAHLGRGEPRRLRPLTPRTTTTLKEAARHTDEDPAG